MKKSVLIEKGFPVPLKRSMRERGKEYQGHQDIDSIIAGLCYWEIKSR